MSALISDNSCCPEGFFSSEQVIQTLRVKLEWKLKEVFRRTINMHSHHPLDYGRLATAVVEFAGLSVIHRIESAYSWILLGEQCFLKTDCCLGKGNYANVYRGFTENGGPCALKIGKIHSMEIECLQALSSASTESNINQMIAVNAEESIMALELAQDSLANQGALSSEQKLIFIRQILSGLKELSDQNIIHSDLKPENVVVVKGPKYLAAKIADFGHAIRDSEPFRGGTFQFYAPEIFRFIAGQGKGGSLRFSKKKIDIWAAMLTFGSFAKSLLSTHFQEEFDNYFNGLKMRFRSIRGREKPYDRMHEYFTALSRDKRAISLFSPYSPMTSMDQLMQAMSIIDPQKRISAEKALELFDSLFPEKMVVAADLSLDEKCQSIEELHEEPPLHMLAHTQSFIPRISVPDLESATSSDLSTCSESL